MRINFFKSEFSKNVLTLMTGTTMAQALPFLLTPLLARIFTLEDFGLFAVFYSLTNVVGVIAAARFELALLLPKSHETARKLVVLSILISIFSSFIYLLFIIFFKKQLVLWTNNPSIEDYLFLLPFAVFVFTVFQIFIYWNNRNKYFKRASVGNVAKSGGVSVSSLSIGYASSGAWGLVLGNIIGNSLGIFVLSRSFLKSGKIYYSFSELKKVFIKFIDFLKYDTPAAFAYSFSTNGVVFLISNGFSSTVTGFYSMTQRIVATPFSIIISSYTQVFNQKIANDFVNGVDISNPVTTNIIKIFKLLVIPFFLLIYLVPYFETILLGEKWAGFYQYVYVIAPLIFFTFVVSPLGYVLKILNKQNISLRQHIFLLMGKLGSLAIGVYVLHLDVFQTLSLFSMVTMTIILVNSIIILKTLSVSLKSILQLVFIYIVSVFILTVNYYLIRQS